MATLWHTCADARESELLGKPSFPLACARGVGSVLTVCGARGEVCAGFVQGCPLITAQAGGCWAQVLIALTVILWL